MASIKQSYPASNADTTDLTITLASMATDSTLLTGRASTAVDNRTNLDLDHLLSGKITTGTTPTAATYIEVYVYAPISIASGTPTYPDSITGTDAAKTMTSANVKLYALRLAWAAQVDSTSNRTYFMPPVSVASLFGELPPFWGAFVTHSTVAALNSTAGNQALSYHRIQKQTV